MQDIFQNVLHLPVDALFLILFNGNSLIFIWRERPSFFSDRLFIVLLGYFAWRNRFSFLANWFFFHRRQRCSFFPNRLFIIIVDHLSWRNRFISLANRLLNHFFWFIALNYMRRFFLPILWLLLDGFVFV